MMISFEEATGDPDSRSLHRFTGGFQKVAEQLLAFVDLESTRFTATGRHEVNPGRDGWEIVLDILHQHPKDMTL